jgi:hypothetical protein
MAFGKTLKPAKKASVATDGEVKKFVWQWLDTRNGARKFHMLPELDENGKLVQVEAIDAVGKVIKGKYVTTPESEVQWLEAWWYVMVDGEKVRRRLILDVDDRWGNPLWKHIKANYEKGSEEWKSLKTRFGVNVLDMTPVVYDEEDRVVYPDVSNAYRMVAGKKPLVNGIKGEPEPLMQIRILEGSAGEEGGKHMLQQIKDLAGDIEDPDGNRRELHEVTLLLKTTGEGIKTNRGVRPSGDFRPLPEEYMYLPRYDIAKWATPWPYEMIERLIEGEDFNELVEEYHIQLFPELRTAPEVAPEPTLEVTKRGSKTKKVVKEPDTTEEDDALFEE